MSKSCTPSFGDYVTNPFASDGNPTKHGYFVEVVNRKGRTNPGKWFRCTDGKGKFWESKLVNPLKITDLTRPEREQENNP